MFSWEGEEETKAELDSSHNNKPRSTDRNLEVILLILR